MDTSISNLDYVLNGHRVEQGQLSSAEWLKIIRQMMQLQKPYWKYLPSIRDHSEILHEICSFLRITSWAGGSPESVLYQRDYLEHKLDSTTRLLPLATLHAWESVRGADSPKASEAVPRTEQYLLFGDSWVLLEVDVRQRPYKSGGSSRGFEVYIRSYVFSGLTDSKLLAAVGDRPHIWRMMFDSLLRLMQRAVEQKEGYAANMRRCLDEGYVLRSRLA